MKEEIPSLSCFSQGRTPDTHLVTETLGGVNNTSLRFLTRLAHRAGADSDLEYWDAHGRKVSYFAHYARALSRAGAVGHAKVLLKLGKGLGARAARCEGGRAAGAA